MSNRQKARDLVALAVDSNTSEAERLSAALKAVALIAKHDLLSSPLDILDGSNETIRAAKTVFDKITDPDLVGSLKKIVDGVSGARQRKGPRRR